MLAIHPGLARGIHGLSPQGVEALLGIGGVHPAAAFMWS
jgi:hypothetical protein